MKNIDENETTKTIIEASEKKIGEHHATIGTCESEILRLARGIAEAKGRLRLRNLRSHVKNTGGLGIEKIPNTNYKCTLDGLDKEEFEYIITFIHAVAGDVVLRETPPTQKARDMATVCDVLNKLKECRGE